MIAHTAEALDFHARRMRQEATARTQDPVRHHQYLRCAIKRGFNPVTGRFPDGVL